nr:hypothetical protein [Tanacetum cinerariifolium]
KSKVRNSRSKPIASPVNACDNHSISELAKLTHAVNQQTSAVTTAMTAMLKQLQSNPPPALVKAVEEICVTCGGAHPYYQCLAAGGKTFLEFRVNIQGNTVANPKGELKAITTRSGLVTDGPTVPNPPKSVNPEEDECVEETYTDLDLAKYTIKVPPPPVQKPKPLIQRNFVLHTRDSPLLHIPYPSRMLKQKQQEKYDIQIQMFWNSAHPYYQCLAADGKTFLEFRDNIQGYVSAAAGNNNQGNPGYRLQGVANQMRPPGFAQSNTSLSNQTNESKNMMANLLQMNTASTSGSRSLPGNTVANPKGKLKAITTRSGLVTDGPTVPNPPKSETYTDPDLAKYTIKVPPPPVQKPKPMIQRNFVLHTRDSPLPHIPYPSRMLKQKQQEKYDIQIQMFWNMFK